MSVHWATTKQTTVSQGWSSSAAVESVLGRQRRTCAAVKLQSSQKLTWFLAELLG